MVATIGNHDVNGRYSQTPEQAKVYYALFQEGYHVLDFGDYMSIFVLDTDHTSPIDGDQHIWLENALIERKDIPHKFAFYHVPAYPSVRKFGGKINARVRRFWVPLFERHDLTAAFEHHDHAYKRTYPIDRGNRHEGGVVYLGDGAWGVKKPRPPKNPKKVWYLAETAATQHFILVTIKGNERAFTAIDKEGKVFDSYTQKNSESGSLDQNFLTDKARRPRPT